VQAVGATRTMAPVMGGCSPLPPLLGDALLTGITAKPVRGGSLGRQGDYGQRGQRELHVDGSSGVNVV